MDAKHILVTGLFLFITLAASAQQTAQEIPVYAFDSFEPWLHRDDGKVYVINFWATWCRPCVKEMPYFEDLGQRYKEQGVEVVLVSLDFSEKLETVVIPFVEKRDLKSTVVLLDDVDSNRWIPRVSEKWSGAIPATLIYNSTQRRFYEGAFTYEELETAIQEFLIE